MYHSAAFAIQRPTKERGCKFYNGCVRVLATEVVTQLHGVNFFLPKSPCTGKMKVRNPETEERFGETDPFAPAVYSPSDLLVVMGVIAFTSLAIGFPGQLILTEARSVERSRRKRKSRWHCGGCGESRAGLRRKHLWPCPAI